MSIHIVGVLLRAKWERYWALMRIRYRAYPPLLGNGSGKIQTKRWINNLRIADSIFAIPKLLCIWTSASESKTYLVISVSIPVEWSSVRDSLIQWYRLNRRRCRGASSFNGTKKIALISELSKSICSASE